MEKERINIYKASRVRNILNHKTETALTIPQKSMFLHSISRNGTILRESELSALTYSVNKHFRNKEIYKQLWMDSPSKICSKSLWK